MGEREILVVVTQCLLLRTRMHSQLYYSCRIMVGGGGGGVGGWDGGAGERVRWVGERAMRCEGVRGKGAFHTFYH